MFLKTAFAKLVLALAVAPLGTIALALDPTSACSPETFSYPLEHLPETSSISIRAASVVNYTTTSEPPGSTDEGTYTVSFCNVTVTYTHPGKQDEIHVTVQLPATWNGKLQALGGAGFAASLGTFYTVQAVAAGYSTVDTDSGHTEGLQAALDLSWALASPGNVNLPLLEDWASTSLHEMAVIGKAVIKSFYGTEPKYSYFRGCSGGGRQGFEIAEKYGDDFNGILAAAPAIYAPKFVPAGYFATQIMHELGGVSPPTCELIAFTQAAVAACDELDGVKDGIISFPELCTFDARTVIGSSFDCNGTTLQFTSTGASIANAAWTGPRSDRGGETIGWFGYSKDADLSTIVCTSVATCSESFTTSLAVPYFQYIIAKDPNFDPTTMTDTQYFSTIQQGQRDYGTLFGSANPDLSGFHKAGGKLISWHGLADNVIPVLGTATYYQQVLARDPDAHSFARFFEAPGVSHCSGGPGAIPNGAFEQLVAWVEDGVAPDTLTAVDPSGNTRNLCPYPLRQTYESGDTANPASYSCAPNPSAQESTAKEFPFRRHMLAQS
jgi:hypothetical protein